MIIKIGNITIEIDLVQALASIVLVDDKNFEIDSKRKIEDAINQFFSKARTNPYYEEIVTMKTLKDTITVIKASLPFVGNRNTGMIDFQKLLSLTQRIISSYNFSETEVISLEKLIKQLFRLIGDAKIPIKPLFTALQKLETLFDNVPSGISFNSTEIFLIGSKILVEGLTISQNFTVTSVINNPNGKWPMMFSNVVASDFRSFEYLVTSGLKQSLNRFSETPMYLSSIITEGLVKSGLNYLQKDLENSKESNSENFLRDGSSNNGNIRRQSRSLYKIGEH